MSPIRLAAALGLVEGCPCAVFNELLVGMGVCAGEEADRGPERAAFIERSWLQLHIVTD